MNNENGNSTNQPNQPVGQDPGQPGPVAGQNPGQPPAPVNNPMSTGQMGSPTPMSSPGGGSSWAIPMWLKLGVLLMLCAISLLVPMGLLKIGAPTACSDIRQERGECKVLSSTPDNCSPSVFNMESEYLTCRMVGAIKNETFAAKNPGKAESCNALHEKVSEKGYRCYAIGQMLKKNSKGEKPDPFEMPPLKVQKLSVLNSVSSSTLTKDFIFTILIVLLLMAGMAIAAFLAHKKNREAFIWVAGVYIIGIFAGYLFRYFVAGFYKSEFIIMIISMLGAVPIVVIGLSKQGKLGLATSLSKAQGGDYKYESVEERTDVPEDALAKTEATRFELMAMQHTPILQIVFILGFIGLVLTLLPIGLHNMGKSSQADSSMKKQAKKAISKQNREERKGSVKKVDQVDEMDEMDQMN
ncbi:MAG: hypothetical protein ACQES9_05155 [Myxococcota bacterium]